MENSHNQTYLANLTTLEVTSDAAVQNTTVKNWLYDSKDGAHAGHGSDNQDTAHSMMHDELINPTTSMGMENITPVDLISNGKLVLEGLYTDIDFNYFDIQPNQRGEGGLLLTQDNGLKTLLHLKTAEMNSAYDFVLEAFGW